MHATSYEVLHFLRRDICPLPRIGPFGLCRAQIYGCSGLCLFLRRIGVLASEDSREERHGSEGIDFVVSVNVGETGVPLFFLASAQTRKLADVSIVRRCRPTRN
jgi:hypothetical protein